MEFCKIRPDKKNLSERTMVNYRVTIYTGNGLLANSITPVHIKLVGTEGESVFTCVWFPLFSCWETTLTISCTKSLGKLILIELVKKKYYIIPNDFWFPNKVVVTSPENDEYTFPIYSWIRDSDIHTFREGKALRIFDETSPAGSVARKQEMDLRRRKYNWKSYQVGLPFCMKEEGEYKLPLKALFSPTKFIELGFTFVTGFVRRWSEGLYDNRGNWKSIGAIANFFHPKQSSVAELVKQHWQEDWLFGYQFLNGTNPNLIKRIKTLPDNFPVTDDLICFPDNSNLHQEMEKGNIYLCDFKNLDGVPANIIDGDQQYMMAPLVLLHKRPDNNLVPIAIQLKQIPGEGNPIFLPTDSHHDWLLAKTFVRSAYFAEHQLIAHLLRTHLLAEVFVVSLLRNLPMVHPLYKLLIPHTRYTMQINLLARERLIGPNSVLSKDAAAGGPTLFKIVKRALSDTTYRSLCLPDSIADRDMKDVPNFYYLQDGGQLWGFIHGFVEGIILHYYKDDDEVQQDTELQAWIADIFKYGFLSKPESGIPERFNTPGDLIKFVTMVIFTCSAQHAAVNSGQYDYGGWMPNAPSTLRQPPPSEKWKATHVTLCETLPNKGVTGDGLGTTFLLSRPTTDFIPLGQFPEEHFTEESPRQLQDVFLNELQCLSSKIQTRNKGLRIPYTYLDPNKVENSVAI
ncbi:polyunsaturated fatty acid lipoxygenase ALOX15B-like isoform X2 [Stigmatopora nigra]